MKSKYKYIVGADEAGRGPLAGPVAVGVVKVGKDFDWKSKLPATGDSKQLSEKVREEVYAAARRCRAAHPTELDYAVSLVSAGVIDKEGIVPAIRLAMARCFKKLSLDPTEVFVLLDGSLHAPAAYAQETIIKGDGKDNVIGLASIMAKVERDRYMRRRAKLAAFTPYDFSTHKGYGTRAHRAAIAENGLSSEHRKTFCGNIVNEEIRPAL